LKELGVDGKILLLTLKRQSAKAWIGLTESNQGLEAGYYEHDNESSGSIKGKESD
jgi:hypothetical protein